MVEVVVGPRHFELIATDKDMQLWTKIMKDCNVCLFGQAEQFGGTRAVIGHLDTQTEVYVLLKEVSLNIRVIDIWPIPEQNHYSSGRKRDFFYVPSNGSGTVNAWTRAVFSVRDKNFLSLAKRLAHAYEAETARRHKPAKAVVLKNY